MRITYSNLADDNFQEWWNLFQSLFELLLWIQTFTKKLEHFCFNNLFLISRFNFDFKVNLFRTYVFHFILLDSTFQSSSNLSLLSISFWFKQLHLPAISSFNFFRYNVSSLALQCELCLSTRLRTFNLVSLFQFALSFSTCVVSFNLHICLYQFAFYLAICVVCLNLGCIFQFVLDNKSVRRVNVFFSSWHIREDTRSAFSTTYCNTFKVYLAEYS